MTRADREGRPPGDFSLPADMSVVARTAVSVSVMPDRRLLPVKTPAATWRARLTSEVPGTMTDLAFIGLTVAVFVVLRLVSEGVGRL
ncbi:hypothetical protein [Streptomyces ardesiacus]|uniref:Uncharacterized protein n=1 Tax=Streptomyces ardesiacus TaxID=285564 RepID=A0ABW8HLB5_9ACTN